MDTWCGAAWQISRGRFLAPLGTIVGTIVGTFLGPGAAELGLSSPIAACASLIPVAIFTGLVLSRPAIRKLFFLVDFSDRVYARRMAAGTSPREPIVGETQ